MYIQFQIPPKISIYGLKDTGKISRILFLNIYYKIKDTERHNNL